MADPTDVGRLGHRYFPLVKNASTGGSAVISRAQSIEFGTTHTTEKIYELGRVGPIGSAQDPTDLRCTWEVNMYEEPRSELVLAGKTTISGVDQSYNMGDIVDEDDNEVFVAIRDTAGVMTDEAHYTECVTTELAWRFAVGAVCATTITVEGTSGSWLTTPIHATAPVLDADSIGGAKGKEARIWFGSGGSGAGATDRAFRLQSFNIRATFPVQTVRELGRRNIVGKLLEPVDVTVDFDVAAADEQPHNVFYEALAGAVGYDLTDTKREHIFIRLYDPDADEATSVIRAWEVHNCRPTATTPVRAQVRGLSTYRYTLTSEAEAVTDSGGLVVYRGDIS